MFAYSRGGLLCKWECATEPEDWEPVNSTGGMKLKTDDEDNEVPEAKRSRDSTVTKELTKFLLSSKVNMLKHRFEDGKQRFKNRVSVTCAELTDKREFAVMGFDDGVFLLVGLPSGELVQELR